MNHGLLPRPDKTIVCGMFGWISEKPISSTARSSVALFLLAASSAFSQPKAPTSPAQFDPSDVYFQGYLAIRAAEQLEEKGDFVEAAAKLEKAQKMVETVQRYYPEWKPDMVNGRSELNMKAIEKIRPKADEQRSKSGRAIAELEGGERKSVTTSRLNDDRNLSVPGILKADPLLTRRLADAETEVSRLRNLAAKDPPKETSKDNLEASRNESRVRDIARQRDALQAQLNAAENNLQTLRNRLLASPAESEMKLLNEKISGLQQEREAMAMALQQSRGAHTEALARTAVLEADLKIMQQKRADLDRDLKAERNIANSVVEGQRSQLQALEKELAQKGTELAKANEKISGLIDELQQSRDAFASLRSERDSLLQERDQMSAMLKLNEEGRIHDLIQQNMGLAKNLREANEKVDRLSLDNNGTKDQITEALRDLAIAKSQINRLHQEKREQDQRVVDLKKRLEEEEKTLASDQNKVDPAEAEVLREIIKRQLSVQERRRQACNQLIEAAKEMGSNDEKLAQAMQLFDGQEIQLTPDEQRLIADKEVDGEFVSPFAQDRATVGQNTSELNRDIAVFERTAEKSFAAGRLLPTRELFQLIIEQNPGHIPALCRLGVVNLKLQDPTAAADNFRRAVELEANNSYAHRMLGYSLMNLGDLSGAEAMIKQAINLAPDDSKSHICLGSITSKLGRTKEAESHYKAAISADPLPSDPYYNLARLFSSEQRFADAKDYYHQALERGALPDPALEELLAQQP